MININNLCVSYGQVTILRNFNLTLEHGGIYALIGPSGCGKSTLLKVLCGILAPAAGEITYNGAPISDANSPSIGYVPQNYGLLAWKTVRGNILLPLRVGAKKERRKAKNKDIISALGLEELLDRYPGELSGGQKQRVALARAFVSQPDLLLMDEPFSALDAFTSDTSQKLFWELWKQHRVTTLFITHNMVEAAAMGREVLLMDLDSRKINARFENKSFASGDDGKIMATAAHIKHLFKEILR